MKPSYLNWIMVALLVAIVITGGCSSLEKAKSLHRNGNAARALEMAQDLLDDDEDLVTRLGAIDLLEEIGGNRAGYILMPILDDETVAVKNAAITAVGRIGYIPASEKMLRIGMVSRGETFDVAAGAIRDIGSPAIDLLVKRYSASDNSGEQQRYKKLMLAVGPSVASGIAKNLAGKSYFENRTNFELLISFKSPEVASWLLKEIGNDEVADNVMEGLVKLGNRAVVPVTAHLAGLQASEGEPEVQTRLITVLGKLKAKQAIDLLEELTQNSNDRVRNAADLALRRIRGF